MDSGTKKQLTEALGSEDQWIFGPTGFFPNLHIYPQPPMRSLVKIDAVVSEDPLSRGAPHFCYPEVLCGVIITDIVHDANNLL